MNLKLLSPKQSTQTRTNTNRNGNNNKRKNTPVINVGLPSVSAEWIHDRMLSKLVSSFSQLLVLIMDIQDSVSLHRWFFFTDLKNSRLSIQRHQVVCEEASVTQSGRKLSPGTNVMLRRFGPLLRSSRVQLIKLIQCISNPPNDDLNASPKNIIDPTIPLILRDSDVLEPYQSRKLPLCDFFEPIIVLDSSPSLQFLHHPLTVISFSVPSYLFELPTSPHTPFMVFAMLEGFKTKL